MGENKPSPKSSKMILGIVVLAILAVVIYAIVQNTGDKKQDGLKNQLELTAENLTANWVRQDGERRHEIGFEAGNEIIYACFEPEDVMPSTISTQGTYSISKNIISCTYTIDMEEYTEQYYAAVSAEALILSPVKEDGGRLKGTYQREALDDTTPDSSSSEPEENQENSQNESNNPSNEPNQNEPSQSETPSSAEPVPSSAWKGAYKSYILMQPDGDFTYQFIYLNDDDIPELYMEGASMALGGKVCAYSDGSITPLKFNRLGCSYIERKNLFLNSDGHMDAYFDSVYSLENGEWVKKFDGSYGAENNANPEIDEYGNIVYIYKYGGKVVTQAEYENTLNSLFPAESAQRCEAKFSRSQIISLIDSMP